MDNEQHEASKQSIRVQGTIAEQVQQTRDLLTVVNKPPTIFRHGSALVRIARDDDNMPIIAPFKSAGLAHHLDGLADWFKSDAKLGSIKATPSQQLVSVLIEKPDIVAEAPVVHQIVTVPVFAPNGTLEMEPGYLPAAKVWYEPQDGLKIPAVSMSPDADDVNLAKRLLVHELLGDFPFETNSDRAHAIALALLPFARHMIHGPTPLHAAKAPTPGTGKGLLLRAALLPAFGPLVVNDATIPGEDELRKKITTWLMEGRALIRFDNVVGKVKSEVLSSAITEPVWADRILGMSRSVSVPVRCIWAISGNNLTCSSEIARRTVWLRIDVSTFRDRVPLSVLEQPRKRTDFKHADLIGWAAAHRGELIWACLTLCQSWVANGMREFSKPGLASFESWSNVMGGILENIGSAAFMGNMDEAFEATTVDEVERHCQFLSEWFDRFGDRQIVDATTAFHWALEREDDLFELRLRASTGATSRAMSTAFGIAMNGIINQVHCGLRLERAGKGQYVLRKLENTEPAEP